MTRTDVTDVSSLDVLNALKVVDPAIAAVLRAGRGVDIARRHPLNPHLDEATCAGAMAGVA